MWKRKHFLFESQSSFCLCSQDTCYFCDLTQFNFLDHKNGSDKKVPHCLLKSIFYCNCKQSTETVCQRWSKICLLSRHSLFWAFLYETLALSFTEAYTVTFTKENNLLWCKGPWIWKNLSFYLINQIQEEALLHCTKYVLKLF